MNIFLIGIQGSGKGTVVEGLREHICFDLISMGQLLRDEIATRSKLGQEISNIINQGNLVSLDIVMKIIENKMAKLSNNIAIFDGCPRNLEQAERLDKILKVDLVIHLDLSKEDAISRLLNRLTCNKCGFVTNKTAVNSEVCPQCGGQLSARADDTIDSINKRFEIYQNETFPLLERYRAQGVVVDINAGDPPKVVLENVLKVINERNN